MQSNAQNVINSEHVSLEYFAQHQLTLLSSFATANKKVKIKLSSSDSVDEIAEHFEWFSTVILEADGFSDGRIYSQAYLLREKYHYQGELCAMGDIKPDQFNFLIRSGFDSFDIDGQYLKAKDIIVPNEYPVEYQPSVLGQGIWQRRQQRATAKQSIIDRLKMNE